MGSMGAEGVASRLWALPGATVSYSQPLDSLLDRFVAEGLVTSEGVLGWICHATSEWDGEYKGANNYVKTFLLRLTAEATANERAFVHLMKRDVFTNTLSHCSLNMSNPSLKLGLLNIMLKMSEHASGVRFIMETNLWKDVAEHAHKNQTIYFSRIGMNFLSSVVWKLNRPELEADCDRIMSGLMHPLLNNRWKDNTVMNDDEYSRMDEALTPTLNILTHILNNVEHFGHSSVVIKLVLKHNLEWHLWNLVQLCRKSTLLGDITKLLLLVRFGKVYAEKSKDDDFTEWDIKGICMAHANLMIALISKRDTESVIAVTNFCFTYITKVQQHHNLSMIIKKDNGLSYEFGNQVLILSILPILCTSRQGQGEFVDLYIEKLISLTCEHTTRMAYSFRDLIKEKNDYSAPIKAIQYAIPLKKYLVKSQAITVFQSFYYRLQDFVPVVEDVKNFIVINIDTHEASQLVLSLLNAIYIYIDEFDIPWQDTVEVLCVYSFCCRIIKTTNIDAKLVIQAFKLAQLTIRKFLSPNLALLVNNAQGSVIEEIGKNIYEKLHDLCWDIRDSAMELLYVVTDIAEIKFPAFQLQIAENDLPELVVTLAIEDSESYVRASALRCISAMVRIQLLWEKHLQFLDLTAKMVNILLHESEGLVRKEAAHVMVNIYEYQKFTASSLDKVFLTMFHAAAEDLHWEVQLAALQFWKKIIANQMSHQGMIDGIFPSVTFSKENRKIVHLNEMEIKRRLKKVLNELALRGCLGVLLSCTKDDSEMEVMEESLRIIDDILKLLDKYNMKEISAVEDKSALRPVFDENFLKNDAELSKLSSYRNKADIRSEKNNITLNGGQNSDKVIESIVNSDDVNLLANVYANQLKVDGSEISEELKISNDKKNISNMFVEPEVFIRTVRETNFRKILEEKRKWTVKISDDMNSLFDDILGTYTLNTEINAMDCY